MSDKASMALDLHLASQEVFSSNLTFLDIPDDVIYAILKYCDIRSLGIFAQVCRRFSLLAKADAVWIRLRRLLTYVQPYSEGSYSTYFKAFSVKEQCRIAHNWSSPSLKETRLIHHSVNQLPWLQLDKNYLWVSCKNVIKCCHQKKNGNLQQDYSVCASRSDVCRFVCKDDVLVAGHRDGRLATFSTIDTRPLSSFPHSHNSDVHDVDLCRNTIVSCSRDQTIKIWSMQRDSFHGISLLHTIQAEDRVWSIALNPTCSSFAAGSAGLNQIPPLRLYNTERGLLLGSLGVNYRNGAGVLCIQYESEHILLSSGYDTYVRLWDTRTSYSQCVLKFEELFDSAVYCLKSDGNNSILSGAAYHGVVWLWDKRKTSHVQFYYTGRHDTGRSHSSPVYSLAFDSTRLYVALDRGINVLDFS